MRNARSSLLLAAALLSACAEPSGSADSPEARRVAARDALVAAIRECTRKHGYDPRTVSGVAENALAPNELPWRQCAYDAVRTYARANPALASMYEQLIAEDVTMTTAVQQGTLTRSQRRTRIEALLAQIDRAEQDQILLAAYQQARQAEQKELLVDALRSMR